MLSIFALFLFIISFFVSLLDLMILSNELLSLYVYSVIAILGSVLLFEGLLSLKVVDFEKEKKSENKKIKIKTF